VGYAFEWGGARRSVARATFWNLSLAVRKAVINGEWPFCSAQGKPFKAQGKRMARKEVRREKQIPPAAVGLGMRGGGEGGNRNWKREERFLSAQADAFAGANAQEKSRPAPFEMTSGEGGGWEN